VKNTVVTKGGQREREREREVFCFSFSTTQYNTRHCFSV